ncbi:MAG: biopolymer transporter ExbD [Alphaproteobacteria bacterium]|nr:biopolymer transporter ExbD [Alphaproteobacteria bacterium]
MQGVPSSHGGDDFDLDDEGGGIFAEINITPLTDVFLVLLIILMVVSSSVIEDEKSAAYEQGRLAERALQIMTPEGAGNEDIVPEDVVVSVMPDRTVFVDTVEVPIADLEAHLRERKAKDDNIRIVLRGDQAASYDVIMDVIARCSKAGLANVALASRE